MKNRTKYTAQKSISRKGMKGINGGKPRKLVKKKP
jgi:hypothetical protein